ncbi:MAG TPA: hypothetical protein PLR60_02685 [Syntrophorhabdaceae bacterium]|nr:hypothetical protein [Syntrophorhabdaceae bacterium]
MEFFVVMDRSILGRGVFGIFSNYENARSFSDDLYQQTHFQSDIKAFDMIGTPDPSGSVYAAHFYDLFYDTYVFDGIYSQQPLAYEAVGEKGLIIRFFVDSPDNKETLFL